MDSNKYIFITQTDITHTVFHWHDELELILVVDGSIELKVGYEIRTLYAGEIMLINCDEIHRIKAVDENSHILSVFIDSNTCYDMFPDFYEIVAIWPYADAFRQLNANRDIIIANINELASAINNNTPESKILECFHTLNKSIIFCYRIDLLAINEINSDVNSEKLDVIYRTIKYIYANFDHKVNLQDISEQEYMNLFHLSHSFKDITGFSFRDWLNFVRAEHAEKLLLQTSLPLSEIAYRCGFSDIRYLHKHFQKWYNLSPNKYRKLFKPSYELVDQIRDTRPVMPMDKVISNLSTLANAASSGIFNDNRVEIDASEFNPVQKLNDSWKSGLICSAPWLIEKGNLARLITLKNEFGFRLVTFDNVFTMGISFDDSEYMAEMHSIIRPILDEFLEIRIVINYKEGYTYEVDSAATLISDLDSADMPEIEGKLCYVIRTADKSSLSACDSVDSLIQILKDCNQNYVIEETKEPSLTRTSENYIERMIVDQLKAEWFFSLDGFKNNVYYFQMFLAALYPDILERTDNYILTGNGRDYKMLIFNSDTAYQTASPSHFNISLKNLSSSYKHVHYTWNFANDDTSVHVLNRKVIDHLNEQEYDLLNTLSSPTATFDFISPSDDNGTYSTDINISSSSLHLLEFTAV